ncbi:MAG: single-stranded-DNA-specific exonuclease RecJ [Bacteroidetes bacterium]|nr:single-stranded-DNA-specific exonuclease RecJ [Bacteroidota bacterium]MBU1578862.1 single-stranded-DNA-specific exonuclease RecJ [Bacteroidota bacterium]MBU2466247.1 single-stranded-DNA-specific exonuclease RecJ [Bacteroidota bacterium]MBU2558715.1 single-stranded-DNA-specific exonuclease RecJ [Bacteroidota bacterium]
MENRWIFKQDGEAQVVKHLSEVLSIRTSLANLLAQRGVTTFEEARYFFRPQLSYLHDPFLMKDMDKAVERIFKAIDSNEKIMIYGDYDVDGTTAVALVYAYLKKYFKKRIAFYIPDRYEEGYGISYKGIDHAASHGINLVIALDCGIKAVDKIKYATELQVDFIICDHHRPGDELPPAVAVLDTKRADCNYPFKELSGAGVGFKLISALAQKQQEPFEQLIPYLDLVAVSIAADIVPITGENRVLAYFGLKQLNTNPRPGFEAVLNYANVKRREEVDETTGNVLTRVLTISDLVFLIGPRINAAGRIEKASDSVRLLLADRMSHAEKLAVAINDMNTERRSLDNQITEEALAMIEGNGILKEAKSTVLYNENWHKGVIGIVASRLTDNYYRPTIILTRSNKFITGSARSVKNFDVYDAIDHCSDLLEHFGGHMYAAGLSLKPENLELFRSKFNTYVSEHIADELLIPEIEIDARINFSDFSAKFLRILKQFAPFGPGNMAPVFLSEQVIDTGRSRIVGQKHLKLSLMQKTSRSEPVSAIAFQQAHHYERIRSGEPFSITYHIEENEWQGKVNLQLNVKDIKFEED